MSVGTVLIVPGIGGCDLYTPPAIFGLGTGIHVWLEPLVLAGFGWRLLGLQPDGITPSVPLTGALQPAGALQSYYGTIRRDLEYRGWSVWSAPLDWRGTIARDADRLAYQIGGLGAVGPIHLLGHSRGGLVIRAALALLRERGQLGLIGRSAGLGVPHLGSYSAIALVSGYDPTVLLIGRLLEGLAAIAGAGIILGPVRDVITSWPAAYELFPSPAALAGRPAEERVIYSPAEWSAVNRSVSAAWLSAAHAAWPLLPDVDPAVQWCDVVGTGLLTPSTLARGVIPTRSSDVLYSPNGDGVVLASLATQPGRRRITSPTSHGAMVYDGRVLHYLDLWFRQGLPADVVITGDVLL